MNTPKKFNKSANTFLIILFYILKNNYFNINEIIDYLSDKHEILVKYNTIMKYIRTLKNLNYEFEKKEGYFILKKVPFNLYISSEEIELFFKKQLNCMNIYNLEAKDKAKGIYNKLFPYLKTQNTRKLNKFFCEPKVKNNKKSSILTDIIKICNEKMRIKIKYSDIDKTHNFILEPNEIVVSNSEYYLYAFNLKKRICELYSIKNILSYERLNQKNKYQYKKQTALLYFKGTLAKSYTKKNDEIVVKRNKEGIFLMTNFYDKELFFRRILRYQTLCKIIAPQFLKKEYLIFIKNLYKMYTPNE